MTIRPIVRQAQVQRVEGCSVLLIEDEPRLRDMLLSAIREMGFEPAGVPSAEAALRSLAERPCDVIVLDLNLPGMSGIEFLELLRQRSPRLPVIILTGYGDLEAARKSIHLDVVDFLTKPCSLESLEIALDRARGRLPEEPAETEPQAPMPSLVGDGASLEDVERALILSSLRRHEGNRAAAAAELGISRRKLYYRIAQYQKLGYLD